MSPEISERSFEEAIECCLVLKTVAAFLNTEGGDLLIGVADNGSIVGIERDQLENDDKFMRQLAQVVRNGLGDRARQRQGVHPHPLRGSQAG